MAEIAPFQAVVYNPEKIKDLSAVACPPYDVISPSRQEYYHNLSPYNLSHILLSKDIPGGDKYRQAGNFFKDWLKDRILIEDKSPAVYFYSQQYNIKGEKKARLGFIARLRLEDKKPSIFGHEHTRLEPREDRLRLLKNVKANLSPIFVIFADRKRIIQSLWRQHIQDKAPFIEVTDDEKTAHKLWRIDSPQVLEGIQKKMSGENIFIADGHHRYEVACAFRDEMRKKTGNLSDEEGFNYIMSYFTNTDPRGLTILPIHRLVKFASRLGAVRFMPELKNYFDIEEIKDKTRFFFLMEKGGRTEHVLGMYHDKKFSLLRLKNIRILDRMINNSPPEFRSLDVVILNHIILKGILGFDLEDKEGIAFSPHADELIAKVAADDSYAVFFLNPAKIQQIITVAFNGNKMPPKSTYFYPKVLSGLLINKLD